MNDRKPENPSRPPRNGGPRDPNKDGNHKPRPQKKERERERILAEGPNARRVALDMIARVLGQKQSLDDVLTSSPDFERLSERDRGFCRMLVATVLRRLGQIDDVIDRFLNSRPRGKGSRAVDILRMGAAQILFMGTPPHAAVGETVSLASTAGLIQFKGMINAVLRRVEREGAAVVEAQDADRLNVPGWLWHSWMAYGEANARAIAAQHRVEAPLDITVKGDAADWAKRLGGELLPTGSVRLFSGGDVRALEGFEDGEWWVQDASAALPARLLDVKPGMKVLDMCAAPGGKTAQLASAGGEVVALDRSEKRLAVLKRNMERLKLSVATEVADASVWEGDAAFDAILLDAPCSATGTIRRHPDIPFLKSPKDVATLKGVQGRMLDHAAGLLAPGGRIVYAVCSLEKREGEEAVEGFLKRNPGWAIDPVRPEELPGLEQAIDKKGMVRILPHFWRERGGMDGFFMARLQHKG